MRYDAAMLELLPSRTVAVELFGFPVHWYGLLYFIAFLLAYALLPRLQKYRGLSLSANDWSQILSWAVIGVIVGGRLGYVVLYEPLHYFSNPWEIPAVWLGGMSSHGGFVGVSLALWHIVRKKRIDPLSFADTVVVPIALGLMLGRIGNFINQELYGSVTTLPWGIVIPGVEGLRHPTQLYAAAKDLAIALICFLHLSTAPRVKGQTFSLFLILYGVLRFLLEYVRVPSHAPFDLGFLILTRGQLYTLPIILVGIILFRNTARGVK